MGFLGPRPVGLRFSFDGVNNLTKRTVINTGGVLADLWPQDKRSVPFALFTTGSSLGPVISPTVGGFIAEVSDASISILRSTLIVLRSLSWRW